MRQRSVDAVSALVIALGALVASPVLGGPPHTEDLFGEARTLEERQQWSQAASVYENILYADPTNADAHYRLGTLREKVGMYDSALKEYREALRLAPDHTGARQALEGYYVATGMTARASGRSDAAIEAFQQALAYNPASATARLELGAELERQGRTGEAIEVYENGTRQSPEEAGLHSRLAALYATRGRHVDAAHEYEIVVRLTPRDAAAHHGLGMAYAALGQRDKAMAALHQAMRFYLVAGQVEKAEEADRLERKLMASKPASERGSPSPPSRAPARHGN